jgi:dihydrofolate reductase
VIVVTHEVPEGWPREKTTVSFSTGGIESAMREAAEIAGDRIVALGSPSIIQQCLDLGLVDRIQVKVVPVLIGDGIRLFGPLADPPIELGDPEISAGNGVTHLHYDVKRGSLSVIRRARLRGAGR